MSDIIEHASRVADNFIRYLVLMLSLLYCFTIIGDFFYIALLFYPNFIGMDDIGYPLFVAGLLIVLFVMNVAFIGRHIDSIKMICSFFRGRGDNA